MFKKSLPVLCLIFFAGIILYNSLVIINCDAYPWWHRQGGNDIDAAHGATTVGLLNDSLFTFVNHPAATIGAIHGVVTRVSAVFSDKHRDILNLSGVCSLEDGFNILSTEVRTGRQIASVIAVVLMILLFGVFYQFSQSTLVACCFVVYIMFSGIMQLHAAIIRPEILTLVFFYAAFYLCVKKLNKPEYGTKEWAVLFVNVGFLISWSILSKVQIVPVVGVFLLTLLMSLLYANQRNILVELNQNSFRVAGIFSLINIVIFPWWTFQRPQFLSQNGYLDGAAEGTDQVLVYGQAPESFVIYPLIALILLLIVSFLSRRLSLKKIFPFVLALNALCLGWIISVYSILAPVSVSWGRYIENTQRLIYATITNIYYHGYLSEPAVRTESC